MNTEKKTNTYNLTLDGEEQYQELLSRNDVHIIKDDEKWVDGECIHVVKYIVDKTPDKQKELPTRNGIPSRSGPPLNKEEILKRCFQSEESEESLPEDSESESSSETSPTSSNDENKS